MNLQPMYRLNRYGYRYAYCPKHPCANKSGMVYEHRAVMSQVLGRPLKSNEVVHHKNRVRDDNRPENLELLHVTEHMLMHWGERRLPPEEVRERVDTCGMLAQLETNLSHIARQVRDKAATWRVEYDDLLAVARTAAWQAAHSAASREFTIKAARRYMLGAARRACERYRMEQEGTEDLLTCWGCVGPGDELAD